ncbi:MAG: class I SAM-dependent methyltransferase [Phycisphaerales bacterium]|nr:MAG: class I SAM-dependent methyltransferase [Phycisphaerales bacterium]
MTDGYIHACVGPPESAREPDPRCTPSSAGEKTNNSRLAARAFYKLLAHPLIFDIKQRMVTADYRGMRQAFGAHLALEDCRGLRILDVGCGTGLCLDRLFCAEDNFIVGVDLNVAYTQWAGKLYPEIHFVAASADQLPFTGQLFDLVLLSSVLHHLSDPVSMDLFDNLKRATTSDATVLLSEPVWSDNRLSNCLLRWDRGAHVKSPEGWLELVSEHFLVKKDFIYRYARTEFLGLVLGFRQSD